MKKLVFASGIAAVIAFSSCEEKGGPAINLGTSATTLKDTTYMATVEQVSNKKVLVEEFTGASCPNCPAARDILKTLSTQNPNRVILVELHPKEIPQGRPIPGESKYDFTNEDVTKIINQFFSGIGSIPIAGIDRVPRNGNTLIDRNAWTTAVNSRISQPSPANLSVASKYEDANRKGVATVKVAYTSDVAAQQYISIYVLEDDIEDVQEYPDRIEHGYVFHHVFRKMVTPTSGQSIIDSIATKQAGRVYEGNFEYTLHESWKPENCKLVVFLHNSGAASKEVLQVEEIKVK